MFSKRRTSSQIPGDTPSQVKRPKNASFNFNSYLHKTLKESGLILRHPPDKCIANEATIHIIRKMKSILQKHYDYPRNGFDLCTEFERECQDMDIFKHYLFPNIIRSTNDNPENLTSDSVVKILLSNPILQNKIMDFVFEKTITILLNNNTVTGKPVSWIQMILKCFSSLDCIADTKKISSHLINILEITSEKSVKREIIVAIPDIIDDQEHDNVASKISCILNTCQDLIPALLECLSYLKLSNEQFDKLQKKTLDILLTTKNEYYSNFVKFLFSDNVSESSCVEIIQGIRNALRWPSVVKKPQDNATSQILTFLAIRNSMISSKVIVNSWLKVISNCKLHTDHKPIDFVILLVAYTTSEEKQKQVESIIRKQVKHSIIRNELLDETFDKFKPILREYLKYLIEINNLLLKQKSTPQMELFASYCYMIMLAKMEDCRQTIVAELLKLGLDHKQSLINTLVILNNVASKDISILKTQSLQMLTLLDRISEMTVTETRAVMKLLCGLAYSQENSIIRDDIHMIIRKELSSSSPTIKIQGILAGVYAVKYLISESSNDNPDLSTDIRLNGDNCEAKQIIELISLSTKEYPEFIAFYYDELSKMFSAMSTVNGEFMKWLIEAIYNDLKENFIVTTLENKQNGKLELEMKYCINSEDEMDPFTAINIGGLALQANINVNVAILPPLIQLFQTLLTKVHGSDLSEIDVLLGCPIVMPIFDTDLDDLGDGDITNILNCLIHCANWFRELLNAFATQNDELLKSKLLQRLLQIEEIEKLIEDILLKTNIAYKPPTYNFSISKYMKDQVDKGSNKISQQLKVQGTQQKAVKKITNNETTFPDISRTQLTQRNQNTIKSKLELIHSIPFRSLNLNLLHLLNFDLTLDNETNCDLTIKSLRFLLRCINKNLESVLTPQYKNRNFLSKQNDTEFLDEKEIEECVKSVSKVLPKTGSHLKDITSFIESQINESTQIHGEVICTSELINCVNCLEYMYIMLSLYFKWIGFKNNHRALFKSSLRTIVSIDGSNATSLKELLLAVAKYLQKHEKYCLQLTTAVSLIKLVKTIQEYSDDEVILQILRNMAQFFLSQQWKTPDGVLERGLLYNQSIDELSNIYFIHKDIIELKSLIIQLNNDIEVLKSKTGTMQTFKCINKNNFPVFYKNFGNALCEATTVALNKKLTNDEHLLLWKNITTILKDMMEIAKAFENRNMLSCFFKKSLPVLKNFLSQGIPIVEIEFKNSTNEIITILKTLQKSTRFLHTLCCHFRIKKDTALMSKVPYMKKILEEIVHKVKAALAANKKSDLFWMGNLRNKDIRGKEILSQQSVDLDETVEEHFPDFDNNDDTDSEILDSDAKSVSNIV